MTTLFHPTAGQVALIEVVGSWSAPATEDDPLTGVVDTGADGILTIMGVSSPRLADGAEVIVSIFAADALYRIRATSHWARSGRLVIDPIADVERIQRRRWPRQAVHLDVVLAPLIGHDDAVTGIAGRTLDLGIGGLRVETDRRLPGGSLLSMTLTLPDGGTLVALTTIVYADVSEERCEYGLAFDELSDVDAARLAALIGLQRAPTTAS